MKPSSKLKKLFFEAIALKPQDRESFLSRVCQYDATLAYDLKKLLFASEKSDQALDSLSENIIGNSIRNHIDSLDSHNEELGLVGPWQLCKLLGKGGMGSVYLAQRADFQYSRKVAVKVLPEGLDDPVARFRFRSEQQILAQLNHENIARFIDGGVTENGIRYIVMDYVEGKALSDWCATKRPSLKQRLLLFSQICRAVQYAHQHNIIHRDLKPANILVTHSGEVKLLDFGVARFLEEDNSELTKIVQRPYTLAYASPEMLKNEPVDKTADIYSLGVILFELLTGKRPFNHEMGLTEYCRQQTEFLNKPGHLNIPDVSGLPRKDLDTIVFKALNPDKHRRYASAQALLGDIDLLISGRPILSRPYSPLYYFGRFFHRHRIASISVTITFLILLASSLLSFTQMRDAQEQRDLANQQQRLVQATNDFLNLLLEETGPEGQAISLEQLLKRGQHMLEQQAASQHQPDYMGRVILELAQGFGSIGKLDDAHKLLNLSEHYARQHHEKDLLSVVLCTQTEYHIDLDFEFANRTYQEAKTLLNTLRFPSIESQALCSKAQAMILERTGEPEKALQVLDTGIAALNGANPGTNNLLFQLLSFKTNTLYSLGKYSELIELNQNLLKLYEDSGRSSTSSYLTTLQNHATYLNTMGEITESAAIREKIYNRYKGVRRENTPHYFIAWYADGLMRLGRADDALPLYEFALKRSLENGDLVHAANDRVRLAYANIDRGKYSDAEKLLKQALEQFSLSPETNKIRIERVTRARATLYRKQGKLSKAKSTIDTLLQSINYPQVRSNYYISRVVLEAAEIALAQRDLTTAERYTDDLLKISRALARDEKISADVGYALALKADIYRLFGKLEQAQSFYQAAIPHLVSGAGESHPKTLYAKTQLNNLFNLE